MCREYFDLNIGLFYKMTKLDCASILIT